MAQGLPGGTSFMEDYTYHLDARQRAGPRRAHARGLPDLIAARGPASRSTRSASAAARTRCAWSSTPTPATAVVLGMSDLGDRFRLVGNEVDRGDPAAGHAEAARRPRGLAAPARPSTSTEGWLLAGGPHHTVLSTALDRRRTSTTSPRSSASSSRSSARTPPRAASASELRWNSAYHRLAGGL